MIPMPANQEPRALKAVAAAQYLSITVDELYFLTSAGKIQFIPKGKRGKRWDRNDLDKYIEENKRSVS